jgi:Molecular chaperone (small heat shock protein)
MTLVPHDPYRHMGEWPFRQLEQWRKDLSRFFDAGFGFSEFGGLPRVDVHETDAEVVAACDIPGLSGKEDVQIDVEDNVLTIQGTIKRSEEIREERYSRQERFTGRFQRSIQLPARVKAEGTTATYKNGVLEIRMPKAGQETKRRIDVQFH